MTIVGDISDATDKVRELVEENKTLKAEVARLRDDRDAYRERVQQQFDELQAQFTGVQLSDLALAAKGLKRAIAGGDGA